MPRQTTSPLLVALSGTVVACSLVNSFSDLTPGAAEDGGAIEVDTGAPVSVSDSGPLLDGSGADSSMASDASLSDAGAEADGSADAANPTFCQRANHTLCAQFENPTLDNFNLLFPTDTSANGGTLTRSTTVALEGKGSLLAQIPSGAVGFSAAQRRATVSGYQSLKAQFEIYPEKTPIATDMLSLFVVQYGNNTTGEYLTIGLSTSGTSLSVKADVNGTSKGFADASQALQVGKWTHVELSLAISAGGTAVRLDLTPDGAATVTPINTTFASATNSMTGTLVTNIAPGIQRSNGNAGSPEFKYYFDNFAVDY